MYPPPVPRPVAIACAAALLAAAAPGCGGGGKGQAAQVRSTVGDFETAVQRGDVDAICTRLLSRQIVTKLTAVGLPCPVALQSLRGVQRPKLKLLGLKVRGTEAFATVRTNAAGQKPSEDTIHLVKESGGWRIDSLSGALAGPPTPANPSPRPGANSD
jgi:hypothetical protein